MAQSSHPSGLCSSFSRLCLEHHDQLLPPHAPGLCSSFGQLRLEDHGPSMQTRPDVDSTTICPSFSPRPSRLRSSWTILQLDGSGQDPIAPHRRTNFFSAVIVYPEDNDPAKWTVPEVIKFFCRDKPGPWAYKIACPDLVVLEAIIRNYLIDGNCLLYHVCFRNLFVIPGLRVIAHCQYLLHAIDWLRQRSPRFLALARRMRVSNSAQSTPVFLSQAAYVC
ncbi:hypothetical protein N7530_007499 [Penicillium desertorum]|uniref:Uncharacterized protein n=1 Tax=Penicillium desertorum TaxID=1303715 RepID=A0A9W9WMH8_9EURO|nr:hypothetical protein N7530_007499 [Penicillium desertorum]